MADKKQTDPNPESTWGASEEYKALWEKEHGEAARKAAQKVNEEAAKEDKPHA